MRRNRKTTGEPANPMLSAVKKSARDRLHRRLATVMAGVIVFTTTYSLILPALTLEKDKAADMPGFDLVTEKELDCPLEIHHHTDSCYKTIDGKRTLVCGKADYVVHVHDANCYDEDGNLVCTLPEIREHTHTGACYKTEKILTCKKEEAEGHTHTDACYEEKQGGLICGHEEHVHTDACYSDVVVGTESTLICGYEAGQEISPAVYSDPVYSDPVYSDPVYDSETGELIQEAQMIQDRQMIQEPQLLQEAVLHYHDESCYQTYEVTERQLTCGLEEHTHTPECYETVRELVCGQEEAEGHKHSDSCYKTKKTIVCGQSDLHTHSEGCYEKGPNGESPFTMGWLKKNEDGELVGDPSHLICGKLELKEHKHTTECFKEVEVAVPVEETEAPETEELLDTLSGDKAEETEEAEALTEKEAGEQEVQAEETEAEEIETDEEELEDLYEEIETETEELEDLFGEEETEEETEGLAGEAYSGVYFGRDFIIHVDAGPEAGLPEDAILVVSEILQGTAPYQEYAAQAGEGLNGSGTDGEEQTGEAKEVTFARFFDISFVVDGEKVEPNDFVRVEIAFHEAQEVNEQQELSVVHFTDKGTETLNLDPQVSEQGLEKVAFDSDTFSVFGIVGMEVIEDTFLTADGQTYKITVTYGPEAEIPTGSKLKVEEILPGTELYDSYNEQAVNELNPKAGNKGYSSPLSNDEDSYEAHIVSLPEETEVGFARYFDISILYNGEEIEPKAAVEVKIEYVEPIELAAGEELQIVHFAEDGIEVITPKINGNEIVFEQESFSVTATVTTTISNNSGYALLVQYGGKYYEVLFDGTLEEVTPSGTNSFTVSTADRWTYARTGNNWSGYNYYIRVQTNTGYEYIDPTASDGISTSQRTITRTASGNGYYLSGGGMYLGVTTDSEGNPVLTGNVSAQSNAAIFYFANLASSVSGLTVDHIDIAVVGSASVSVPLAYGTYYYANGSEAMTVEVGQFISAKGVNTQVPVTEADLMSATISAYTKDSAGNRTYDNSFIISQYTSSTGSGQTYNQVRVGGTFPIGTVNLSQRAYRGNVEQYITSDNQIYYEVDVTKPVELTLQDNDGNILYQKDGSGNLIPLRVTVNVTLMANFSYWDDDNECPGISYFGSNNNGAANLNGSNGSGMDFVLGTSDEADATLAAIEIIKYTVNTDGQLISVQSGGTFNFDIYQNTDGDVTAPTAWSGETTAAVDYNGYTRVSSRSITAGESGYGVSYDYSVDRGLVYIQETGNLDGTTITDTDGNTWDYVDTYIQTEYVWRDDDGVTHSNVNQTDKMRAIPDVVGDYYSTTYEGELHNTFLEFYVYNVYKGGEVEFKKVDQSGNLLPGATFGLYLSDPSEGTGSIEDISGSSAIKAYEATSAENSEGNVEVDFESVAYGTYYMYEIAAPEGYVKDNGVYKVEVYEAEGNEYCKVYGWNPSTGEYDKELDKKNDLYVFPNYPEALDVSILKTIEDGETALPGAVFSLYGDDYYAAGGTTVNPDAEVVSSVTTGSDGKVSLGSLPSGTYYLVETAAPAGLGYKVLSAPVKIMVDATVTTDAVTYESPAVKDVQKVTETVEIDGTTTQVTYYLITIKDDPETTEVPVEKIWVDNNNAYNMRPESISVQLKVGEEVKDTQTLNANNEWKYTWENLPAYTYTTEEGVITGATAIDYNVVETGDITGYTSVTTGDATTGFTITNTIDTYDVGIQKIGDGNENTKLNGAEFKLYTDANHTTEATDSEGNVIGTKTTAGDGGTKGKATIGNLLPGTYYLVETKSPDGYNLLSDHVVITIDARGVTYGTSSTAATVVDGIYTITVSDPSGVELPMTGGSGTLPYTLSGIALMLGAALMYGFRLRRRERRLY